ncbi:hypothetical protein M0804_012393 [Polistes exclamans]|nr:hypothetical protein M0804_012393 [Polistes exclamans]
MSEEVEQDEILETPDFGPPKSLQKLQNADILWQMIKKRFPNAAPLLCEMETVIDRADDLLQELRMPRTRSPDGFLFNNLTKEINVLQIFDTSRINLFLEISNLNNLVDSGESDEMISLICDEFFPVDTDVVEEEGIMMNTAGTQISESSISTLDTDFDSISSNQPSLSDEKFNNLKEDFKHEEHRKDNDNFSKETKEGNKKIDVHLRENEQNLNERTKSSSNAKETIVTKIFEKVQENNNTNSSGDWKDNVNVENHYSTLNNSQDNKQMRENVDRINLNEKREIFIEKKINDKTPLDILEDYANKCKIEIQYHCEKNKCNRFVITGKLSEFSATDCGDTEILVKNNIAKIILQNIADHQMNDKDMKQLLELSREQ